MGRLAVERLESRALVADWKKQPGMLGMRFAFRAAKDRGPFEDLPSLDEFLDGLQLPVQRLKGTNELTITTDFRPEKPVVVLPGWKKGE